MRAKLLLRDKFTDNERNVVEWVVWEIPISRLYPDGVRYRLAFIPLGMKRPTVLYDNHHPKGHHKHLENLEQPYYFFDIDRLIADFKKDVAVWKKAKERLQ